MNIGLGLLFLILLFQLIIGSFTLKSQISQRFRNTCILSFIGLLLFSYIGFSLVSNELIDKNIRCGMPLVGYMFYIVVTAITLVTIMGVQGLIRLIIQHLKVNDLKKSPVSN